MSAWVRTFFATSTSNAAAHSNAEPRATSKKRQRSSAVKRPLPSAMFMRHLERPRRRLRFALRPGLRAHDARSIRRHVHPRLQVIPDVGRPIELLAEAEQFVVRADLQLFLISFENDFVALIDQTHVG